MNWMEQLPKKGPFAVRIGAQIWEGMKGLGLAVVIFAAGAGLFWMGSTWVVETIRVQQVWADGTVVDLDPGFDGEVTTSNFIFNDYEMVITYDHPAGQFSFDMELMTFFTGPDESTPMVVHAMASDPMEAVTNWQADTLIHSVGWCLLGLGIGAGFAVLGLFMGWTVLGHLRKVRRLAAAGTIHSAPIEDLKTQDTDNGREVTLRVRLPAGQAFDLMYTAGVSDPHFVDEEHVAVLASGDEAILLTSHGHPLRMD